MPSQAVWMGRTFNFHSEQCYKFHLYWLYSSMKLSLVSRKGSFHLYNLYHIVLELSECRWWDIFTSLRDSYSYQTQSMEKGTIVLEYWAGQNVSKMALRMQITFQKKRYTTIAGTCEQKTIHVCKQSLLNQQHAWFIISHLHLFPNSTIR